MKVFIVFDNRDEPYESRSIWAIFDSRDKAVEFVKANHYEWYANQLDEVIEEYTVNSITEFFQLNKPKG